MSIGRAPACFASHFLACVLACVVAGGCVERPAEPLPPAASPSAPAADAPAARSPTASSLRVLVVDDPALAESLEQQWQAADAGAIQVSQITSQALCRRDLPPPATDVWIYPSALLGELAERGLLATITDETLTRPDFQRRDVLELVRLRECTWGEKVFALPLGSPQLVMIYRSDLLEKLGLEPPADWNAFQTVVERLADRAALGELAPADATPWFGSLEPTGEGWACETLLARAASMARHRNQFSTLFDFNSMSPLVDQPPFVRALESLVAAEKSRDARSPSATRPGSPAAIREAFLAGQCGLAITWPSAVAPPMVAPSAGDTAKGEAAHGSLPAGARVQFAPLPGSADVFSFRENRWERRDDDVPRQAPLLGVAGRLGSIAHDSRRSRAAANLLVLLSGSEWSRRVLVRSESTAPFRESQLNDVADWLDRRFDASAARNYGDLLRQLNSCPLWLASLRIPGRLEYQAALDAATRRALAGEASPQDSLRTAAGQWRQITERFDVQRQRAAYRRSLGLEL